MSRLSLKELVLTGTSGGLSVGMTIGDVLAQLGEPIDRSITKSPILQYGPLELSFDQGELFLLAAYLNQPERAAEWTGVIFDLPGSLVQIEDFLRGSDVDFVPIESLTFESQSALKVLRSNASLIFDENQQLDSVQLTRRVDD
jgi:hypothetical protein